MNKNLFKVQNKDSDTTSTQHCSIYNVDSKHVFGSWTIRILGAFQHASVLERYSEPNQTSKMKLFAKTVKNDF